MSEDRRAFFSFSFRLWGLFVAAGTVACSATVLGFLGRFSWFLDLFSHFRVQYLVGLTLIAGIVFAGRRRKTAVLFLVFAGINLALVLPLYLDRPKATPTDSPPLRAMLLNVNTEFGDPDLVKSAILASDPDLLVLEEISAQWISDLEWLSISHPHSVTEPREDNFGIGLFSKFPITASEVEYIGSALVPSILASVDTGKGILRVVATHPLPPAGRDYSQYRNEQLDELSAYVQSPLPLLLIGDLNVTPWNDHFRRLLKRTGLLDSSQGFGVQPTWPNYSPFLRIPIDHCLHSSNISIVDRSIGPDVSSDHYPLIVDFTIGGEP